MQEAEWMNDTTITKTQMQAFRDQLCWEEKSPGTMEKYCRDVAAFAAWLGERPLTKDAAGAWKAALLAGGQAPATINAKLAALNRFFSFLGTARTLGRERLALLLEAICATGIRVSEVRYLTVEAALAGRAVVRLKGKIRTILLPGKLCRKLLKYARKQKTASGEIFLTRSGRGLSRRQIWAEMKSLCARAGVEPTKVFPHNLRHLFARTFYRVCRDVAKLADVLGHSSIETTRIYLISTGAEHAGTLERMGLVC